MAFLVCFLAFFSFLEVTVVLEIENMESGELILSITADMLQHSSHSSAEEETFRAIDYCIQHAMPNLKYCPPTNSLEIFFRRDYQISLNALSAGGTMGYHEAEYTKGPMIKYIITTHCCLCLCALSIIHHKYCKFSCSNINITGSSNILMVAFETAILLTIYKCQTMYFDRILFSFLLWFSFFRYLI